MYGILPYPGSVGLIIIWSSVKFSAVTKNNGLIGFIIKTGNSLFPRTTQCQFITLRTTIKAK